MNLAILAIVKNEDPHYINEWREHHAMLGVEHFYFLSHQPNDIPIPVTTNSTVWDVPAPRRQAQYYYQALQNIPALWTAVIDVDEFIICKNNLQNFLDDFKDNDAIGISWLLFGSSGHDRKVYPVKDNYHWRARHTRRVNAQIKSIVKTKSITSPGPTPHMFNFPTVDENGELINTNRPHFQGAKVRINHYYTKSREDWQIKLDRGRADCHKRRHWLEFDRVNRLCTYKDETPLVIHGYADE